MAIDDTIQQVIAEARASAIDQDDFKEVYWTSPVEADDSVAVVVAKGDRSVGSLREAMTMLREEKVSQAHTTVLSENQPRSHHFPRKPYNELSEQRNSDVDIVLDCMSDMVRTSDQTQDHVVAVRTFQASCAHPEEVVAKCLVAVLQLMAISDDLSMRHVATFLKSKKGVRFILQDIAREMDRLP